MSKTQTTNKKVEDLLDLDKSYEKARSNCKYGCLINHEGSYIIPNNVWACNQRNLMKAREGYDDSDKDKTMKETLYHKLLEKQIDSIKSHVQLKFSVLFDYDDYTTPRKIHNLCESCFVTFNSHRCIRTWNSWKKNMKQSILVAGYASEAAIAFTKKCETMKVQSRYENISEARKYLEPLGLKDIQHWQWACVPDSDASRECYLWLYKFFELVGSHAPNRDMKIQLPGIYTKESIHKIYQHHTTTLYTGNEHDPLEIRAFQNLWQNVFPNVSISQHCHVDGKCFGCHAIYQRQEVFTCEEDLKKIRQLSIIHKILIEMQRGAYISNRNLAQECKDLYMSLIIDGMSQNHCVLPYYGGKDTESGTIMKQKIMGAKQHGFARTFYRFYPHIKSGANMACEILLHEIERRMDYCIENDLLFPRYLYLQIDGGAENTSHIFYGLCEHLVRASVFNCIEAARLPVGHTHEDIDALFGVLWRAAQGKSLVTPQAWKKMAIAAFIKEEIIE